MARNVLIQIRRGLETNIGNLAVGELGFCEDTKKLYIGTSGGNVLLVASQTVGDMLKSVYDTNNNGRVDDADKVNGLTVLTAVPANAKFTDTVYTHPASHPPSIISQDANNRFMTDAERSKLSGIAAGAQVNRAIATKAQAEAGIDNTTDMTPLRVKEAIAAQAATGPFTWNDLKGV